MTAVRWAGVLVSGAQVRVVDLEVPDSGALVMQSEQEMSLQEGDRAEAFAALSKRLVNFLRETGTKFVVVKGSALPPGGRGATLALLESAELRGAVVAAAASVCPVRITKRGTLSRTFGSRKVDEYLRDDAFWLDKVDGKMAKKSREAVLLVLAEVREASED